MNQSQQIRKLKDSEMSPDEDVGPQQILRQRYSAMSPSQIAGPQQIQKQRYSAMSPTKVAGPQQIPKCHVRLQRYSVMSPEHIAGADGDYGNKAILEEVPKRIIELKAQDKVMQDQNSFNNSRSSIVSMRSPKPVQPVKKEFSVRDTFSDDLFSCKASKYIRIIRI